MTGFFVACFFGNKWQVWGADGALRTDIASIWVHYPYADRSHGPTSVTLHTATQTEQGPWLGYEPPAELLTHDPNIGGPLAECA
jgi:hypothetical protein